MTIASEVQRIKTNIASAYSKCEEKGATMPDNENSANLANTIDSIPTGGGGGTQEGYIDFNSAEFDMACGIMDSDFDTLPTSAEDLIAKGWTQLYNRSIVRRGAVFEFADFVNTIRIDKTKVEYVKIPTTATIEVDTGNFYKVTYNGTERYLLVHANQFLTNQSGLDWFFHTNSVIQINNISSTSSIGGVRGFYYYSPENTTTNLSIDNVLGNNNCDYARQYLRRIKIDVSSKGGSKFASLTIYSSYISISCLSFLTGGFVPQSDVDNVFSQITDYVEGSYYTMNSAWYSSMRSYLEYGIGYVGPYMIRPNIERIPIIWDATSYTGTGNYDFFTGSQTLQYTPLSGTMKLKEFRVKIPASPSDIYFGYQGVNEGGLTLSLESWQYIAENAPTVSGDHTIHVGNGINWWHMLNGSADWQKVRTDLIAKGWTLIN